MKKKIFKTDSCSPQLGNWEQQLSNAAILEGTYSPNEVKNLIGKLDFYIIGRLYVGVAVLSQFIPTVMLAYGHKHFGFSRMLDCDEYVWHPSMGKDKLEMIVRELWKG